MLKWLLFALSLPLVGAAGFFAANESARRAGVRPEIREKVSAQSAAPATQTYAATQARRLLAELPSRAAEPPVQDDSKADIEPYLVEPPKDLLRRPPAEVVAYERELQARVHADLADRFEHQALDPSWRSATEVRLLDAFKSIAVDGVDVGPVACKKTMCRATVATTTREEGNRFIAAFISALVPGLEHHFQNEDGRVTIFSIRHDS